LEEKKIKFDYKVVLELEEKNVIGNYDFKKIIGDSENENHLNRIGGSKR